uniref:Uncharacterized protein n=1 Tax=Anguilla anguilla TaxID=7936 RepID=A0A0E9WLA2_ANGAN
MHKLIIKTMILLQSRLLYKVWQELKVDFNNRKLNCTTNGVTVFMSLKLKVD